VAEIRAPIAVPQPAKAWAVLHGIRQADIARATGTNQIVVSRVLSGLARPTVEFAQRLSAFLGVPEDALLRPERKPVSPHAGTRRRRKRDAL
jgi:transcriptional regulator with XRE-family HTH domain